MLSGEFLAWADARGVAPDARYTEPRCLVFCAESFDRFWEIPQDQAAATRLFADMLTFFADSASFAVWPRAGGFWGPMAEFAAEFPVGSPFRSLVEREFVGAARIDANGPDPELLAGFLACVAEHGWNVGHDVFVVSDDGGAVLHLDHHDAVWVESKDEGRLLELVRFMEAHGHSRPTEPLDETFKRPEWM